MKIFILVLFLIDFWCSTYCSTFNINAATVLLPHTSIGSEPILYTLTISGEDGCFEYTNSRDDLIEITPKNQIKNANIKASCVDQLQLKTISNTTSRETSIINLYDNFRGYVIRTHVIVAHIHRIEIVTRTRDLYVGDVKEKLEVIAYDSFGNIFNSVTGPRFEWTVKCITSSNCKSRVPISLVDFSSSNYDVDNAILNLESRGFKGNMVLVDPLTQGEVYLRVRCLDPYYSSLYADVSLVIREYILLEPSENLYAIQGSYITFQVFKMIRGKLEEIILPSKSYSLNISNSSIATLHSDEKSVFAQSIGTSTISIVDKTDAVKPKIRSDFQVLLNVIDPTHILFYAENQENWVLEINKIYNISILARYHERALNVSNLNFNISLQSNNNISKIFHVPNSLNFQLELKNIGSFEIFATIYGFSTKFNKQRVFAYPITASIFIQVVHSITITPSLIIFPFINSKYALQEFKINATGGTNRYIWKSSPSNSFIKINYIGHVSSNIEEGIYKIHCIDEMSKYISSSSVLKILPISSIRLTPSLFDIAINKTIYVNIKIFVKDPELNKEIEVTNLYSMPFIISFSNPKIFDICQNQLLNISSICLVAKSAGFTNITVDIDEDPVHISASIKLSSFNHIRLVDNIDSSIPGSISYVSITDGPLTWISNKFIYPVLELQFNGTYFMSTIEKQEFDSLKITTLKFTCINPGNENVKISVSHGMNSSFSVDIINIALKCFHPNDIKLKIIPKYSSKNCFYSKRLFLGYGINSIPFILQTLTKSNIYDISTLNISIYTFPHYLKHHIKYQVQSPISSSNQYLYRKATGILILKTKISRKLRLIISLSQFKAPFYKLMTIIPVYIVPNISTENSNIVLLNHDLNIKTIPVLGGSGHFSIRSSTDAIKLSDTNSQSFQVKPIKSGASTIFVKDICCSNVHEYSLSLHVTTISHINVIYPQKLLTNNSASLIIYVFNEFNELVNRKDRIFINIFFRYKTTSKLTILPSIGGDDDYFSYTIYGDRPSLVNFAVEVSLMNTSLIHEQIEIEVFDPVSIIPNSINLVPGVSIQLMIKGGPSIGSNIKFEVGNKGILALDSIDILLALKSGQDTLSVICYQYNTTAGGIIVYSRDSLNVSVSEIFRVGISIINNRFFENSIVPANIIIYNSLGMITTPFKYPSHLGLLWTIDDTTVLSLVYSDSHDLHVYIQMKKYGSSTIMLQAHVGSSEYSASQLVYVIQEFDLSSKCSSNLLLPINVEYKINHNWRSSATISYNWVNKVSSDFKLDVGTGVITTPKFPTSAILLAELKGSDRDTVIIQQLSSILIEIASIGTVYVTSQTQFSDSLNLYAVGSLIKFNIHVVDTFGRKFNYFPDSLIGISLMPSGILQLIDVKDMVLFLRAVNPGSVRLEINTGTDGLFNHFTLINIHNPVNSSRLNLQVTELYLLKVSMEYKDNFNWISSNPDVALISSVNNSALILALSSGESVITLIVNDVSYTAAYVNIVPVKQIFFKSTDIDISNYANGQFYIDLDHNTYDGEYINTSFSKYPIACELKLKNGNDARQPSTIDSPEFKVMPTLNPGTKKLSCLIESMKTEKKGKTLRISTYELTASLRSYRTVKTVNTYVKKDLTFMPKYHIKHPLLDLNYLTIEEMIFNKIEIESILYKDTFLISCDLSCVRIKLIYDRTPSHEGLYKIIISLDISSCLPLSSSVRSVLHIIRPKTNQKSDINILVKNPISSPYQNFNEQNDNDSFQIFNKILVAIILIGLSIFIYYFNILSKICGSLKSTTSPLFTSPPKIKDSERIGGYIPFNASMSRNDPKVNESNEEQDLTKELYTHKKKSLIDFS